MQIILKKIFLNYSKEGKMQNKVREFNEKHQKDLNVNIRMLDIVSEAGELAKEVIKGQYYGEKSFEITPNFESEIGDMLYSLLSLANEVNIDAEKALENVLKKYDDRFSNKGNIGSGKE